MAFAVDLPLPLPLALDLDLDLDLAFGSFGVVVVAGGVGANRLLREQLDQACARRGIRVHYPEMHLCTDNGAMIALAAAMRLQSGLAEPTREPVFDVKPRWDLSAA